MKELTPTEIRQSLLAQGVPGRLITAGVLAQGTDEPTAAPATAAELRRAKARELETLERRKMLAWCELMGLPAPAFEFTFHPVRDWRFDYAWVQERVALEKDGGLYPGGAHSREENIRRDQDKGNEAQLLGWYFLRRPASSLFTDATAQLIRRAIGAVRYRPG